MTEKAREGRGSQIHDGERAQILRALTIETIRLHRLDARLGLRRHVSDALLQLLAQPRGEALRSLRVVATRRHLAGSAVHFSRGNFVRARHGKTARSRYRPSRDRNTN